MWPVKCGPSREFNEFEDIAERGLLNYGTRTSPEQPDFNFCWDISGFHLISRELVKSHEFYGGISPTHIWCLELYPSELSESQFFHKCCIALRLKEPTNSVKATFELVLFLNGLFVKKDKLVKKEFNFSTPIWVCENFFDYLNPILRPNVSIKIQCNIWIEDSTRDRGHERLDNSSNSILIEKKFEKLSQDLGKLLKSPDHTDFQIIVDGKIFKVHKIILSARSSVFSTMFSTEMIEKQNSILKIDDFDPQIVELMIEFIYTGKTPITTQNVQNLFQISEKYDLPDLKSECEMELIKILEIQNAISILNLADKLNAPSLKSKVIDFILWNKNEISKTSDYETMLKSNGVLCAEILKAEWNK